MSWKDVLLNKKKEDEVKDPENKPDKPAEKSPAELIAESLKPITDAVTAMRADIEVIKNPPKPKEPTEVASVLDDENAAFAQRLTPILAKTFEMEAKLARQDVEREYRELGFGDLWNQNRADIDKFLDNSPLVTLDAENKPAAHRGNPDFIRNVVDMVIGRSARKAGVRFDSKDNKFFLEDATGEGATGGRTPLVSDGLSNKQIEAAKRLGISVKDYKAAKDKLNYVQ